MNGLIDERNRTERMVIGFGPAEAMCVRWHRFMRPA
jgi:hypothetical protein